MKNCYPDFSRFRIMRSNYGLVHHFSPYCSLTRSFFFFLKRRVSAFHLMFRIYFNDNINPPPSLVLFPIRTFSFLSTHENFGWSIKNTPQRRNKGPVPPLRSDNARHSRLLRKSIPTVGKGAYHSYLRVRRRTLDESCVLNTEGDLI